MTICGTGHRPNKLGGYGDDVHKNLTRLAQKYLKEMGAKEVVSGMALGWDQALAVAAIMEKIPLVAAIPFKGQEGKWPKASQTRFGKILSHATETVYVCDPGYAAWKMQKRNEWMVDRADVILALWDGSGGGTSNCIEYAEKKTKTVVNLWKQYNGK